MQFQRLLQVKKFSYFYCKEIKKIIGLLYIHRITELLRTHQITELFYNVCVMLCSTYIVHTVLHRQERAKILNIWLEREFTGGPVVRTLHFHCWVPSFNPWLSNLRSHKMHGMAKKESEEKKKKNLSLSLSRGICMCVYTQVIIFRSLLEHRENEIGEQSRWNEQYEQRHIGKKAWVINGKEWQSNLSHNWKGNKFHTRAF